MVANTMNAIKWIVVISSLQLLIACASKGPQISDELDEEFVTDAVKQKTETLKEAEQNVLETVAAAGVDTDDSAVSMTATSDSDSDGIIDSIDTCANTATGAMVDPSGCEIVMGIVDGVTFGSNSTELSEDSKLALGKYVEALTRYSDRIVIVEAHTDNRGAAADNLALSEKRARAVAEYLVSNGVSVERVRVKAWGENRPFRPNATARGREQNRRIEINVIEGLL